MIKSSLSLDYNALNSPRPKNYTERINEKHKTYFLNNKLNNNKTKTKEKEKEKEIENDNNISYVEKIKIYHAKKNSSNINSKQIKKLYHNEINKNDKKEIKVIRNKSKARQKIAQLKLLDTNLTVDNLCLTEKAHEKNEDFLFVTMATTPKRNYTNNYKNLLNLNRAKRLNTQKYSSSLIKNINSNANNNKKCFHQRNVIKSYDFRDINNEQNSNLFLTTQGTNHDLFLKYLGESDNNYSIKEGKEHQYIKNFEINKIFDRELETKRKKSVNNFSLKDNIKNDEVDNKYCTLRTIGNYNSQKGSLKNLHLKMNSFNKKRIKELSNLSQKNIYTPRNISKHSLKTSNKLYKSLSKSKQNINIVNLNKTFCFPKTNFQNFNKNNYKKNLFIDAKNNNKYLAPIIESNIVIENENCHFLENTICGKNKIVKKKKNINNDQNKDDYPTFRKVNTILEAKEKKNKKEKEKNEKEKYLLTETNKKMNKLTFTKALNKLYKRPQKKAETKVKNNIKAKKNYNNIPDMLHQNRNRSIQKGNLSRSENIDLSMSNLSTIANSHIFNGKIDDYLITKELGKGSYATVKLAMHKITKFKYAIKIYTKESLLDPQKRNTVRNEINILKQLNHNNIMKLYEVIDCSKCLYLVLEYIKGISLLELIKSEKCHYIEQNRAIKLFLQIVKAISYCQSKNINHRDIKLENILVLNDDTIKLIDFGFAVKSSKDTYQKLLCGTPSYMPPEIVNKEKYIAQYSDVWSLGVLLYTMLYGRFPFRAKEDEKLFKLINRGHVIFPDNIDVDDNIKKLIKKIINFNPKLRPTPDEIINDLYLLINLGD